MPGEQGPGAYSFYAHSTLTQLIGQWATYWKPPASSIVFSKNHPGKTKDYARLKNTQNNEVNPFKRGEKDKMR